MDASDLEGQIIEAGVALIPKIFELISRAKAAKSEEHASILAQLADANAALSRDAKSAREAFDANTKETEAVLHPASPDGEKK